MKTVIGQFYTTEKSALRRLKQLNKLWKEDDTHVALEFKDGWLVVGKDQLKKRRNKSTKIKI